MSKITFIETNCPSCGKRFHPTIKFGIQICVCGWSNKPIHRNSFNESIPEESITPENHRTNTGELQTASSPISKINNSTTNLGCLGWGFIIFFVLWIFSLLNPSHKESCSQMDNDLTYPKGTPDKSYLQKFDKYVAECTK